MKEDDPNQDKPVGMRYVIALGFVSFFTDFSPETVLGILPLFIITNLGAPKAVLGGIEGSAELISYVFRMASGSLSDKLGKRKIFVLVGYGLSTVSKPFFALTTGWLGTFLVRAADRIGKELRTAPRDALIADSIAESGSGKAFGIHRTIDQGGAIACPIAAFALLQVMDIRGIFLVSLIPGTIAVVILIFLVREVAVKRGLSSATTAATAIPTKIVSSFSEALKGNRPFTHLIIISGIFSLGAFNYSFILLKATDLRIAYSDRYPTAVLADRIGKEKVLTIDYAVFAVSSSLMIIFTGRGGGANNFLYACVLAAVFGIYVGISETLQRAVIPKYVSSELRGTAYGIYNVVVGVGFFVSNIVFGYFWDNFNLLIAVLYSICFAFASIIGMLTFIKKYPMSQVQVQ